MTPAKASRLRDLCQKVLRDNGKCPACSSNDVHAGASASSDNAIRLPAKCHSCGTHWVELYRLEQVVEMEEVYPQ